MSPVVSRRVMTPVSLGTEWQHAIDLVCLFQKDSPGSAGTQKMPLHPSGTKGHTGPLVVPPTFRARPMLAEHLTAARLLLAGNGACRNSLLHPTDEALRLHAMLTQGMFRKSSWRVVFAAWNPETAFSHRPSLAAGPYRVLVPLVRPRLYISTRCIQPGYHGRSANVKLPELEHLSGLGDRTFAVRSRRQMAGIVEAHDNSVVIFTIRSLRGADIELVDRGVVAPELPAATEVHT